MIRRIIFAAAGCGRILEAPLFVVLSCRGRRRRRDRGWRRRRQRRRWRRRLVVILAIRGVVYRRRWRWRRLV